MKLRIARKVVRLAHEGRHRRCTVMRAIRRELRAIPNFSSVRFDGVDRAGVPRWGDILSEALDDIRREILAAVQVPERFLFGDGGSAAAAKASR